MANVKNLYAKIMASADGFDKVMNGVADKTQQVSKSVSKANSSMTQGFQNLATSAGNKFSSMGKSLQGVSKTTGEVGSKMTKSITKPAGIAAGAVGGLVGALGFKRLIGMDAAEAKLKGLGYQGKEVTKIQGQVESAIEGGMTTMAEGTDIAAGGLAAGVEQGKDLEKYIKLVGDAAVGSGRPVGEMSQIFARIQGSGKVMTEELNMIEQGMPGFAKAMADDMGVPLDEFREKVTNGEVSSEQFMETMDTFAGKMSKEYAKSFEGMIANTKAFAGQIGEKLLKGAFEKSKKSLGEFLEWLSSDKVQNGAARLGEKVGTAFSTIINVVSTAVKWFAQLPSPVHKVAGGLALLAVAAGPVLQMFSKLTGMIGGMFSTFGKLLGLIGGLSPVGLAIMGIVAAVIALGTAFYIAYQKSETFRNFVNGIGDALGKAVGWVKQFGQAIAALFGGDEKTGTSILEKLGFNEGQISTIQSMVGSIKSMFMTLGQTLGVIFARIGDTWNNVVKGFQDNLPFFKMVFDNMLMIVKPIFNTIWNVVKTVFTAIVGIIQGAMQTVQGIIQVIGGIIQGNWGMVWEGVKNIFFGVIQILISLIKGLAMTIVNIVVGIAKSIGASFMAAFNVFKGPIIALFTSIWNGIKFVTMAIWNGIVNAVVTSIQTLRLRAMQILNFLKAGIMAIWNGIKFAATWVWTGIKTLILTQIRAIRTVAMVIFQALRAGITAIFNGIKFVAQSVWNGIKFVITNAVRIARSVAIATFNALRAGLTAIFNGIRIVTSAVWNGIKNVILAVARGIRATALAIFRALRAGIVAVWNGIRASTSAVWNFIRSTVVRLATALKNTALAVFRALRAGTIAVWNGIKAATSAAWNWIKNKAVALARSLRAIVLSTFRNLRAGIIAIWNAIKAATSAAWNWIKNKAIALARSLRAIVLSVFRSLRSGVSAVWNGIKSATSAAWNWIKNKAVSLAQNLRAVVLSTFNKLRNGISGIWNGIKGMTSKVWTNIKNSVIGFANGIKNGVTGAFNKMKNALSKSIDAIKGFVQSMIDKVKGGLNKLIDGVNWVGEKLGMGKIGHVKMHTGTTSSSSNVVRNGRINTDTFATVGDKGRGNGPGGFRHETVIPPKGKPFITPNRDVTMPVTKGTKILNGTQTHGMLSDMGHKFAGGSDGKKNWWQSAGSAVAGFGKGAAKKAHDVSKSAAKKVGEGAAKGMSFAKSAGSAIAGATAKGTKWLGNKVKDVMDFVKNPGKLLEHILKAFGVNFDGLGKGNIPADMMKGMFTKLKDSAKNLIKQWLEEAEEGSGDASWLFKHPIWQKFGNYTGGLNFNGGKHYGMDFGMPIGTDVKAVADGKVSKVWNDYGGGKSVEVQVGKGLWNWYMHLSKIMAKKGQKVSAGDVIGKSGDTGNFVRGAHLHFQLNKGDHSGNDTAINPESWLKNLSGGGKNKAASKWAPDIKKAAKAMKVNLSNKELQGIIAQIQRESNGNAGVTQGNIGDINNKRGTPAQGLLQYVPSTFKAYAKKGHTNIKSGYDQLLAFFNNSNWRKDLPYGKSGWGPSGARRYAEGGIISAPELAWIAEGGFSESVISHDPKNRVRSKAIHDKTGKMLGVDDDTMLLQEIIDRLDANNQLQSIGNNYARQTANKDTNVYVDGKNMTKEINTISGSLMNSKNYNHGD